MYTTPEELTDAVDEYFTYIDGEYSQTPKKDKNGKKTGRFEEECVRDPEPPTVTGLALFLGFSSRQSLDDCAKLNKEYSDIIKRGKLRIEHGYEKRLHGDKNTGAIFALKNMAWDDKVTQEMTGPGGGPIQHRDLSKLTKAELKAMAAIEKKLDK